MPDRGGGRETKGASLKTSKKNPGSTAAKVKKEARAGPVRQRSDPPPVPIEGGRFFDCGAALLSRQFDRDRDRVISRAQSEGQCSSILLWFSDIEKQQLLADITKNNTGFCYFSTGIHPDNIDRTNMKSHKDWLERIEDLGRRSECLALITGLNLTREMGTHFAQESLLKSSCEVADRLGLPLVLHCPDISSLERAVDNLREVGWTSDSELASSAPPGSNRKVIVHDVITVCGSNPEKIANLMSAGLYCVVSGAGITELSNVAQRQSAFECLKRIPRQQLLMGSDSPWKTPQNHPDEYLRTLRNEPANCPFVVTALAEGLEIPLSEMEEILKANAWRVFGLDSIEAPVPVSTVVSSTTAHETSAAATAASATGPSNGTVFVPKLTSTAPAVVKKKKSEIDASVLAEKLSSASVEGEEESAPKVFYSCHKCRHFLFPMADVYNHAIDAFKTVFKAGEQGLCKQTIFLTCTDDKGRTISRPGLSIPNSNVECKGCGQKLGKYSVGDSPCACGAMVKGPCIRISDTKVDFNDKTLETEELLARSQIEVEDAIRQEQLQQEENERKEEEEFLSKKEKKKKVQTHKRGGGNFSEFRNKSFQPNQSRKVVALTEEQHREMALRDAKIKEDLMKKKKNQVTLQNIEKSKQKNGGDKNDDEDSTSSSSEEGNNSNEDFDEDFDEDEDFGEDDENEESK